MRSCATTCPESEAFEFPGRQQRRAFIIRYGTLGTNDLARTTRFYDELLAIFGAKRGWESEQLIAWTTGPDTPMVLVIKPHDGKPATVGNGMMVALAASSKA